MFDDVLLALEPHFTEFVVRSVIVLLSVLLVYLTLLVNKVKSYLITKIGKDTYEFAIEVATGIYVLLEDQYKDVIKAGDEKRREMDSMLLSLFPSLTQIQLDAI